MIIKCSCKHEGQDKLHGKGMRVHNICKLDDDTMNGLRCTVCLNEKDIRKIK